MRKIIASTFLSLDGVIQSPGAPLEDPSNGFSLGGWSFHYWDELMGKIMEGGLAENYDLLLGRKTYEIYAAHWPFAGDNPVTRHFNKATKYVASRTLETLAWQNSTLLGKDVAIAVEKLKSGNGPDLQVHGSSVLLQTLNNTQLVDEYRLWIFPVVIGQGKRLFAEGAVPQGLKLTDSKVASTGVMINTYRPTGAVKPGSFALDNLTAAEIARREKMAREG